MIEVKAYIKSKLQKLASSFPNVEIAYAYNQFAETHIIQLTPQEEYYNNKKLDEAWITIVEDFLQKFPCENISFVSVDSNLLSTIPEFKFNISTKFDNNWDRKSNNSLRV